MAELVDDLFLRTHILELEDQCKAAGEDLETIKRFYEKAIAEKEAEVEAASDRMMKLHEEVVVPAHVQHTIIHHYEERIKNLEESLGSSVSTREVIKKIDQLLETLKEKQISHHAAAILEQLKV